MPEAESHPDTDAAEALAEVEPSDCGCHVSVTLMDGRSAYTKLMTLQEAALLARMLSAVVGAMLARGAVSGRDRRH